MVGDIGYRVEVESEDELNALRDWLAEQIPGLLSWSAARVTRPFAVTCVQRRQLIGVEVDAEDKTEASDLAESEGFVVAHVEDIHG